MPHRNEYHPSQPAGWLPEPTESFFSDRTPMQALLLVLDTLETVGQDGRPAEPSAWPMSAPSHCPLN